jgi:hypothetical protein
VWNSSGEKSYTPKVAVKALHDLDGGTNGVSGAVRIGPKPVLLEGK